jgi:hypothetical protein
MVDWLYSFIKKPVFQNSEIIFLYGSPHMIWAE